MGNRIVFLLWVFTSCVSTQVPPGNSPSTQLNMISVEGGTFLFLDKNITMIPSFQISQTEVTQKQWKEVMEPFLDQGQFKEVKFYPTKGAGDNFPVYHVDWYDAVFFCNVLSLQEGLEPAYHIQNEKVTWVKSSSGYRLPTEAEWEYAAKGGSLTRGYAYAGGNDPKEVAWSLRTSGEKTHPVGTRFPNELGLYDMSGNVMEWCWDTWDAMSEVLDPTGRTGFDARSIRGGAWNTYSVNTKVVARNSHNPRQRGNYMGFRVAKTK